MAGVDPAKTNRDHARMVAVQIKASKQTANSGVFNGMWHWINGVASGLARFGRVFAQTFTVAADYIKFLTHTVHFIATTFGHAFSWLEQMVLDPMEDRIEREIARERARERRDVTYLVRLIYVVGRNAMQYAAKLVRAEKTDMLRHFRRAEAQARLDVRRLHHRIEHEAYSGYAIDRKEHTALVVRLLEFAGAHNALIRPVVKDIATGLIDLLSVDDPVARIAIGFLIKHVIDRMGIEKPLGHLIADLMSPLLGQPNPRDLHDVIAAICARLGAMESQWSTFMQDGGSEVEQAGKDWQAITGVASSVAIAAFTTQAVVDPSRWASEIQAIVGRPANDLAAAAARLFRG